MSFLRGWLLFCLLLAPLSGAAQDRHTLWKVESKTAVVYLMGSIHAMKPEHYPLPQALETAFDRSVFIVTEVDVDSLGLREVIQGLAIRGLYTDGTTLSAHVTPEVSALVKRMAESIGLNPQMLQPFRPWLTALTLTSLYLQKKGFTAENGLDRYFYQKAKTHAKPRRALETIGFQTEMLAGMPDEMQMRLLEQTLKDYERADIFLENVFQSWKTGDTAKMDSLLTEDASDFPEIHHRMFSDRNLSWIPHIENYLSGTETGLVIVGAGHLVGRDGVVELLRRKGYDVEQQ
ncbi:MAG: TraB/GumN family protein [candidate division Zixibacteria bacterium]|nr:TraB/GumN family protein [candidate division Zixibacteria bacterium]